MGQYNISTISEVFSKSITLTLINLIFTSIITMGLGISPKYGLISIMIGIIVTLFSEKHKLTIFAPSFILIGFLQPLIARHGIETFIIVMFTATIITYGFSYLKLTRYLILFPRPIFISILTMGSLLSFFIGLKYILGLKTNITHESYYLNIISLYKNLKFTNWTEALIGISTLISFLFFEKFELKSWSYIFSFFISIIFSYCLISQGYQVAYTHNNLGYFMSNSVINLNFDNSIPLLSNILLTLHSFKNIQIDNLSFYLITSSFVAIFFVLEATITSEICTGNHSDSSDKIVERLSLTNIIAISIANFIVSYPLGRNYFTQNERSHHKLINILQFFIIYFLIIFCSKLFNYIPLAGLAALLMVISYKLSNLEQFIWFARYGTKAEKIILFIITVSCIMSNILESLKLGVVIAACYTTYRFALPQIKHYLTRNPLIKSINNDSKIKNSTTFKIQNASFFSILADSISNLISETTDQENLIIDITHITDLDLEGIHALDTLALKQSLFFKEIVICCNESLFDKINSELKTQVRIILSSNETT